MTKKTLIAIGLGLGLAAGTGIAAQNGMGQRTANGPGSTAGPQRGPDNSATIQSRKEFRQQKNQFKNDVLRGDQGNNQRSSGPKPAPRPPKASLKKHATPSGDKQPAGPKSADTAGE